MQYSRPLKTKQLHTYAFPTVTPQNVFCEKSLWIRKEHLQAHWKENVQVCKPSYRFTIYGQSYK